MGTPLSGYQYHHSAVEQHSHHPVSPAMSDDRSPRTDSRYARGVAPRINYDPEEVSPIESPRVYSYNLSTIVTGGALLLFSFLIFPALILIAFLTELIEADISNREEKVHILHFRHTARDGFRSIVLALLAFVPAVGIWLLTALLHNFIASFDTGLVVSALPVLAAAVSLGVTVVSLYVFPAIYVQSVRTNSIRGAFSEMTLASITTGKYALNFLYAVVILCGSAVVSGFFGLIPFIGWIGGPTVQFYGLSVSAVIMARAVVTSRDQLPWRSPPSDLSDSRRAWRRWEEDTLPDYMFGRTGSNSHSDDD